MGASREGTESEKALNRCVSEMRSLDKMLWHLSGKSHSCRQEQVVSFGHLRENIEDFNSAWGNFQKTYENELKELFEPTEE